MTLLPTPTFDFHWVISTLVAPLTTSTLTSPLVKTSRYCPHTNSAGWFPHNSWGNLSTEFSLWGEGGWIGVCKSANPLWFINQIRPSIIAVNPKSRQKNFNYTQRPKSGSKKIYESAIHCDCRIQKSIKISLWIWNPGKNIFKIRQSIRLFIPLLFGSHFINNYSHNCFSILHIDIQGCALAEPVAPGA